MTDLKFECSQYRKKKKSKAYRIVNKDDNNIIISAIPKYVHSGNAVAR